MKVGVLALQGNFFQHGKLCERLDLTPVEIRYPRQLDQVQGLIIPGGESTTMTKLMERMELDPVIREFGKSYPILGTCAGLILMVREVKDERVRCLDLLDLVASRNAFGRQIHSFVDRLKVKTGTVDQEIPATFIRAPRILSKGAEVKVLSTYNGEAVAVKQGSHLGLTFHPELNGVTLFHEMAFYPKSTPLEQKKQQSYAT